MSKLILHPSMGSYSLPATYRAQLANYVRLLAAPNLEARLAGHLAAPSGPAQVKMFVDGNLEKRLEKLRGQLEFVAQAFEDFEPLLADYIRESRLRALATATSDGEAMLAWLEDRYHLSAEQADYVTCQRTRHAIEEQARANRLAYVQFHERLSLSDDDDAPLVTAADDGPWQIYLNPIRRWARFTTAALLDDQARPPVHVLFFAAQGQISTAILELEGQALLNELVDLQPGSLDEWSMLSQLAERETLRAFARDLCQMGLAAVVK